MQASPGDVFDLGGDCPTHRVASALAACRQASPPTSLQLLSGSNSSYRAPGT
jgi:hypothetical protein